MRAAQLDYQHTIVLKKRATRTYFSKLPVTQPSELLTTDELLRLAKTYDGIVVAYSYNFTDPGGYLIRELALLNKPLVFANGGRLDRGGAPGCAAVPGAVVPQLLAAVPFLKLQSEVGQQRSAALGVHQVGPTERLGAAANAALRMLAAGARPRTGDAAPLAAFAIRFLASLMHAIYLTTVTIGPYLFGAAYGGGLMHLVSYGVMQEAHVGALNGVPVYCVRRPNEQPRLQAAAFVEPYHVPGMMPFPDVPAAGPSAPAAVAYQATAQPGPCPRTWAGIYALVFVPTCDTPPPLPTEAEAAAAASRLLAAGQDRQRRAAGAGDAQPQLVERQHLLVRRRLQRLQQLLRAHVQAQLVVALHGGGGGPIRHC